MKNNTNDNSANKQKVSQKMIYVALFAALISVCGFISIPVVGTPVPIVLQNMLVVVTGLMLGPAWGSFATLLFLGAGALGLPIFSGGTGGIARFLGPTGGFLYGYALATLVSGLISQKPCYGKKTSVFRLVLATVLGFVVMYIPGVLHFMFSMNKTFSQTLALCVIPYIPGDVVKMVVAILLASKLRNTAATYIFGKDNVKTGTSTVDNSVIDNEVLDASAANSNDVGANHE